MARPLTGTTLALTDTGTTALVVGGAVGATAGTGTILSGPIKIASATPSDTSMKLYNIAGTLTWNGTTLAAGSSVSGTTGKLPKFTSSNSVGDSIVAESGTIITVTGTLNATTAIQLNGTSINTGATLTNVAYLDQSNTFSNASGQKFAAGIGIDGGVPSTHGIMMPTGVPGVTTTTLYNNSGVLTWPATGVSVAGTLAVTGVATLTAQPILSSLTASQAVFSDASKGLVSNAITGTGNVVMSASPTLTGTAGMANGTFSGTLGVTGVATFTAQSIMSSLTASSAVATDASKGLVSVTNTGTGNNVLSASPTLTGTIGAAAMTLSSTLGVTGLITSTGGITGGAASHTTGAFSDTITSSMTSSASSTVSAIYAVPSTASNYVALRVGNGRLFGRTSGIDTNVSSNTDGFTHTITGAASTFQQNLGAFTWSSEGSQTAGTVFSGTTLMALSAAGDLTINNLATGSLTSASGVVTSSSDERLKDISGPLTYGLSEVLALRPIRYHWNATSGIPTEPEYGGFGAAQVESVMPLAVSYGADGYRAINDRVILAACANAIQAQDERLRRLEDQVGVTRTVTPTLPAKDVAKEVAIRQANEERARLTIAHRHKRDDRG